MADYDWNSSFSHLDPRERHHNAVKREPTVDAGPRLLCDACGGVDFDSGDDGFYYCRMCGSQSQDVVDTGCADEDILGDAHGVGALYSIFRHRARSQSQNPAAPARISRDDLLRSLAAGSGGAVKEEDKGLLSYGFEDEPSEPRDFGAGPSPDAETLARGIRLRYVQGLQVMLQLQCEALVEKFGVSPMICGLAGTIWLRYLASSRVFDEDWGQKVIAESEAVAAQSRDVKHGTEEQRPSKHIKAKYMEPHNAYGQRSIYIWLRALRKTIPVYSSLAISFLACHIAREAILPTDIQKWASEAKLAYLTAFLALDKYLGSPLSSCPLTSRLLFKPVQVIGAWQLEVVAGSISQKIGLHLPSVNFYAIASRYLKDLALPTEKILPHACRLYEWSTPAELWLSCNTSRLPTRVCVMAILIVTIRILYNIHGQGFWEMSLLDVGDTPNQTLNPDGFSLSPAGKFGVTSGGAKESCFTTGSSVKNMSRIKSSDFNTKELLGILQATYDRIGTAHDYSRDLRSYLKYCQGVVFAGMTSSYDEETLIERLWETYDKQEDEIQQEGVKDEFLDSKGKRQRDEVPATTFFDFKKLREQSISSQHTNRERSPNDYVGTTNKYSIASNSSDPNEKDPLCNSSLTTSRNAAVERMKLSMEENRFQYLPPRVQKRTDGYLHYKRKKLGGKLIYVAHADYYIVLRACAKLAEVDTRIMHLSVLKFERRLAWIEQRIGSSLNTLRELLHQMHDE